MLRVDEVEDAILDTLKGDTALKAYVKTFTIIPALDEESLSKLIKQFPAIGVISDRGEYSYAMSNVQQETGTFLVLCFNRNLRSPVDMVRGGTAGEKGVWHMIDDCRSALLAGSIGLTIIDCLAMRRNLLFAGEAFACASLEVELKWRNL